MRKPNETGTFRQLIVAAGLLFGGVTLALAEPEAKKAEPPKKPRAGKPVAQSAPPEAFLNYDAWKDVPSTPLEPGEIDRLLEKEFDAGGIEPSPPAGDEAFLRRVRLDLTGTLPTPAEIEEFLADEEPEKRARLVEWLLEDEAYGRHWARYWRQTIAAVEAPFGESVVKEFEDWLAADLQQNKSWAAITRALVTAEGALKKGDGPGANGAVFFLGRHNGPDGDIVRTSETARLFLGIQIQCAQCHNDRRTGLWKQVQFHEMAGFYARLNVTGNSGQLVKLVSKPNGEHEMPDRMDPKAGSLTYPRFLDGQAPAEGLGDRERRQALADYLTSEQNYWFSAALVNRIWSELLGQPFYERVDDLSPKSAVVFPALAVRLAAAFRGSGYDLKALFRAIATSQAYQREVRLGESLDAHLKFAGVYPAQLRADVLWQALSGLLGPLPEGTQGLDAFKGEFDFDPSLKADEVAGSITQALWMLNSPLLNDRIKVADYRLPPPKGPQAKGKPGDNPPRPTLLKALLAEYGDDDDAVIRAIYLHTLARRPTERELQTCRQYLAESQKGSIARNVALEDILKALINSTEFLKKR
jgi:hypothetical protein